LKVNLNPWKKMQTRRQKLHFSFAFFLLIFLHIYFCNFLTDLKSASNSVFFNTHIEFMKKLNFCGHMSTFLVTFKSKAVKWFFINESWNLILHPSTAWENYSKFLQLLYANIQPP
jgi:hypothetical protein